MSTPATTKRQARRAVAFDSPSSVTAGKIAAAVLLLGAGIAGAVGVLFAAGVLDPGAIGLPGAAEWLTDASMNQRLSLAGGSAALGILSLAILLRRSGQSQSSAPTSKHIIAMDDRGVVFVASEGVSSLVAAAVQCESGVIEADVRVRGRATSPVRLIIRAAVRPGVSLPEAGEAIREAAKDTVVRLVGLQVTDVKLELVVLSHDQIDRLVA